MNSDSPRLRLSVLGVVTFSLFAALFARLWYLQVMANDEFQVAAEANRIRVVAVEAPRGRILDREGTVIVDNRVSVQVTIDRSVLGELDDEERHDVLARVADGLARSGIPSTVEQLEERIADQRFSPYVPVPIAGDVPEDLKIWIDEHADELPSVAADRVAVRHYPYGRLAAHVVGYTGKISKEELDAVSDEVKEAKPYTLNDEIGKFGVEKLYETELRGTPGLQRIEVDANGDPVRIIEEDLPRPGDDIVLNLDIDVQAVAEQALQSGLGARPEPQLRQLRGQARRRGRLHGRARSAQRRRAGHGVVPELRACRPRRRDQRNGVGVPQRQGQPLPAEQLGPPGPVRPGLHVQALHRAGRDRGRPDPAEHVALRRRRVRGAELQGRLVHVPERQQQGVRERQPALGR